MTAALKSPQVQAALLALGVVVALYYLLKREGAAAVDSVAGAIADPIIDMILPGAVEVLGDVILPTGARIAMSNMQVDRNLEFTYLGLRYRIVRREGPNYIAERL